MGLHFSFWLTGRDLLENGMVGVEGFEPPALWSQTRCATRLRYTPTPHLVLLRDGLGKHLWRRLQRQNEAGRFVDAKFLHQAAIYFQNIAGRPGRKT